jgi:hypothetical protein
MSLFRLLKIEVFVDYASTVLPLNPPPKGGDCLTLMKYCKTSSNSGKSQTHQKTKNIPLWRRIFRHIIKTRQSPPLEGVGGRIV